jgi:hypothetical protein
MKVLLLVAGTWAALNLLSMVVGFRPLDWFGLALNAVVLVGSVLMYRTEPAR